MRTEAEPTAGVVMTGANTAPVIPSIVAATAALIVLELVASLPVSRYGILAVHLGVVLAALWRARCVIRLQPDRAKAIVAAVFIASVALVLAAAATAGRERMNVLAQGLMPTLAGWAAFLVLWRGTASADAATEPSAWRPTGRQAAAFLTMVAAVLVLVRVLTVGQWAPVGDEPVYYVQSRWMSWGQLALPVDPALADFFRWRKVDYTNGHLYGMYPPGWPALLAGFRAVGLEWWSGVILGVASVVLVHRVARRLGDATFAAIAAVLLGTSQYFLMLHAGYMSHAGTITAALAAVLCLLVAEESPVTRQRWLWIGAGALIGFMVTVRPLSGLALGAAIGGWMLLRLRDRAPHRIVALAAWVALGGLPLAGLLLWHNHVVYGELLTLGYSHMSGAVYDLGFGPRGVTVLDSALVRQPATFEFTPAVALSALFRRLAGLNITFVPIGLLLPLTAMALARGFRVRWQGVVPFALLPAVHLFYWYGGLRLYSELLPFVLLAVAAMVAHLWAERPAAGRAWLCLLVAASVVMCFNWPRGTPNDFRRWADYGYAGETPVPIATLERADSLRRAHGRILLFVRDETRFDNLLGSLFYFNHAGLDGPVVVARDLGERNAELLARHPDRTVFLVTDRGRREPAMFTPIRRSGGS